VHPICSEVERFKSNKELEMAENISKQAFLEKIYNYETNKEWKFEGELPCVVDFWAPWCGPCRMVGPVIEELSKEYAGKVNFYKVNTDEEQELAGAFGIRSIPSLLMVPKSGQPKMAVGALPKNALKEAIEKELLAAAN
jgi:thioredoxin 1